VFGLGRVALAERVLHRERMQPVFGLDPSHFLMRGLDQSDPVELGARRRRTIGRQVVIDQLPIAVTASGNDRHGADW
jgi:hypothetical protein